MLIRSGDTLHFKLIGLDYEHSTRTGAYFNGFYAGIEHAARSGCDTVDLGMGMEETKRRLGSEPEHRHYRIDLRKPLLRPLGWLLDRRLAREFGSGPATERSQGKR